MIHVLSLQLTKVEGARGEIYLGNDFQIHIVLQLHILGMDPEHLQAASLVRHSNINLTIEAPKSPQRRINAACHSVAKL